jgi:catechol 2,3-dioxygenase-like lactoylglutathione lyase family enzyme
MPRGTDDAPDYGSVGAATPIDEEHLPLLPGKLRRRTTRAAAAAAACLVVAGTVAIARRARPTEKHASLFARPDQRGETERAPPNGVVKHTYATSDVDAAVKAFGSLPVALAPWGGDGGCSIVVPGDVLKNLGGAPVDCVAYALAAHNFPETYGLAPCECECGAVGRVQLLTADDLAGASSFSEGFGLHHVDARARSVGDGKGVAEVEAAFREAYGDFQKWDPLMDMNVKLYSSDLREYMSTYFKHGQPYFLWFWTDAFGRGFASVAFAQGTTAGAVVEVFSDAFDEAALRAGAAGVAVAAYPRYAFPDGTTAPSAHFGASSGGVLYAAAVSHFVSDLAAASSFYRDVLVAEEIASYRGSKSRMAAFGFGPHGVDDTVQVLLVESFEEGGPFSVRDFETTLNEAHAATLRGVYAGENKWLDFHYAISGTRLSMAELLDRATKQGATVHFAAEAIAATNGNGGDEANLYVVTPNGVSVQIVAPDGTGWVPGGVVQNVAGDLCASD